MLRIRHGVLPKCHVKARPPQWWGEQHGRAAVPDEVRLPRTPQPVPGPAHPVQAGHLHQVMVMMVMMMMMMMVNGDDVDDNDDDDDDNVDDDVADLRKLIRARVPGESDHGEPSGGAQGGPSWHGVGIQPE